MPLFVLYTDKVRLSSNSAKLLTLGFPSIDWFGSMATFNSMFKGCMSSDELVRFAGPDSSETDEKWTT
jgi:hypothetical protein